MKDAVFSDDRKSISFTIIDGGFGDEDGVKNGVIVDPLGIGIMSQTQNSPAGLSNNANSDSCYIDTLTSESKFDCQVSNNLLKILIGIFMIGFASVSARHNKKIVRLLARYNK